MSYTPPTGVVAASWVGAAAYKGPVRVLFGRWAGGTYITPAGNNELTFGTPFVTKQQFANHVGFDSATFSPALVARGTDYIPPLRDLDARWASDAQYEPPAMPLLVAWDSGPKGSQYVFAKPIDSLEMGEPSAIWTQIIAPVGVDGCIVGAPVVRPPPLNASWYGANEYTPPVLELWARWGAVLDGRVYANGWQSGVVGIGLSLRNHRARIDGAGSIPPASGYGSPSVWLYTRYLKPGGTDTQAHGTQWASHWLRYITAAGVGDKTARGTPWVSRSPRDLAPAGFDAMKMLESHVVGGTRTIAPVGTEMTQWGTRIIPEGQTLYPQGFAGEVGTHDVQLYTRYLRAQSFQTNHDELRFGRQDVWNLRQYVTQDYDPNDGLNPPGFGRWTGIENRNKEPVPVGWLSERHGYTSVMNNAAVVSPKGIDAPADAPTYKAGSITHRVRPLQLDGWDSAEQSRWAAVFNIADIVAPIGDDGLQVGSHGIENRSRLYDKVGNFDSMAIGTPMVSERVRQLRIEERHTIEPPQIELPEVKLHTRYLEYVSAGDFAGAGMPVLDIRWTVITPRWAFHPPAWIGEPALRNVTPELHTGGANHEEFGTASIRTQWRTVETKYGDMVQWGRPIVRDRRHWVEFVSVGPPPVMLPGPVVTKVGGLPDPQNVMPRGIEPPTNEKREQVPKPTLNMLFTYANGFSAMRFGDAVVTANSIRVEPGFRSDAHGTPVVALKKRALAVPTLGEQSQVGRPRMSPHTIYAVMEAPQQAKDNHLARDLHYVDRETIEFPYVGSKPGYPTVSLQHRALRAAGASTGYVGQHTIFNRLHYVVPKSIVPRPFGLVGVSDGRPRRLTQTLSSDLAAVGRPTVGRVLEINDTLAPAGMGALSMGAPRVELFKRAMTGRGFDSMAMGTRKAGDTPYQWQGLRAGPLVPTIPEGFVAEQFGTAWVSLRVRDVGVPGIDGLGIGYDLQNFRLRMRVQRANAVPDTPPAQSIGAQGWQSDAQGWMDIRNKAHVIRPDGNAEQYRKGAPL